jgi:hypothetical protein
LAISGDRYREPNTRTAEIITLKARCGFLAVAGRPITEQDIQPAKEQRMFDSKKDYIMKGQFTAENTPSM